ncbi:hypothetical protein BaRGS_00025478 [Batillaria attramentaria]|uniref:Uncharacterized protein n=1 Tax=Batillaria attramentaria TaxID=370345 RepID=A0ABD0K893_9CAEN
MSVLVVTERRGVSPSLYLYIYCSQQPTVHSRCLSITSPHNSSTRPPVPGQRKCLTQSITSLSVGHCSRPALPCHYTYTLYTLPVDFRHSVQHQQTTHVPHTATPPPPPQAPTDNSYNLRSLLHSAGDRST